MAAGLRVGRLAANLVGYGLIALFGSVIVIAIVLNASLTRAEELAAAAKSYRGLF